MITDITVERSLHNRRTNDRRVQHATTTIRTGIAIGAGLAAVWATPAAATPGYMFTAARGATTTLTLRAPANARCEVSALGARGGRSLAAFSNAQGLVRYFVTTHVEARGGTLALLECRSATAHTITGLTLLAGQASANLVPARQSPRRTIADLATNAHFGVLPGTPLGFDVTQADEKQLARLGYPNRPNAQINPSAYAFWRKLVTTPGAYVPPGDTPNPQVRVSAARTRPHGIRRLTGNTLQSTDSSAQDSGVLIEGNPSPFDVIAARWNVPSVDTGGNDGTMYSQTWMGIEGTNTTTVSSAQVGTEQDVLNVGIFALTSYYPWYAFGAYPAQHVFANMAVAPGDYFAAEALISVNNIGTPVATYYLWDFTSGHGTFVTAPLPASAGPSFWGFAASWMESRSNHFYGMPNFHTFSIANVQLYTADRNSYHADGSNTNGVNDLEDLLFMTSDGTPTGNVLSVCGNEVDTVYCSHFNFY